MIFFANIVHFGEKSQNSLAAKCNDQTTNASFEGSYLTGKRIVTAMFDVKEWKHFSHMLIYLLFVICKKKKKKREKLYV